MNIWDKEIEVKAAESGLIDLLALARSLWLDRDNKYTDSCGSERDIGNNTPSESKPLQKPINKTWQQNKPYRISGFSKELRERVKMLRWSNIPQLSCQEIADQIKKEYNQDISKSTVSRIINNKYNPKPND